LDNYVIACPNFFYVDRHKGLLNSPHCGGNFWWARGDYISMLQIPLCYFGSDKYEWEFFVTQNLPDKDDVESPVKVCVLAQSGVGHYLTVVPRKSYSNQTDGECVE